MNRIVIVRHAKSDWTDRSLDDHDRPLAPRGVKALSRMRDHLTASAEPDLVLCSSARRSLDTLEGIRPALPDDVDVRVEDELYDASPTSLVDRLGRLDEAVMTVMLVGHNPGLHDLAIELVGEAGAGAGAGAGARGEQAWERLMFKFPTGAIATLSFNRAWADIEPGCADLDAFFTPRPPR